MKKFIILCAGVGLLVSAIYIDWFNNSEIPPNEKMDESDVQIRSSNQLLALAEEVQLSENANFNISTKEDLVWVGTFEKYLPSVDSAKIQILEAPKSGEVQVRTAPGREILYKPRLDFFGQDQFSIRVSEGNNITILKFSVTVEAVNDAPQITTVSEFILEEDTMWIAQDYKISDVDSETLKMSATSPRKGVINFLAGQAQYTYSPDKNAFGQDRFILTVSDGKLTSELTVSVTIKPIEDDPLTEDMDVFLEVNEKVDLILKGSDPDGDPLLFTLRSPPTKGELEILDSTQGKAMYTHSGKEAGEDSFEFVATDSTGRASTGIVNLTIQ
jgi:hypothetical protein